MENTLHNLIGGQKRPPLKGRYCTNLLNAPVLRVPLSDMADVQGALDAAGNALGCWSNRPGRQRLVALEQVARKLGHEARALCMAEAWEAEHPVSGATSAPLSTAIGQFRSPGHQRLAVSRRDRPPYPLASARGEVVKLIIPGNVDYGCAAKRMTPLLATGHCLVVCLLHKQPNRPTASLLRFITLVAESLPAGVVNVISGTATEAGSALVNSLQGVTLPLIPLTGNCPRCQGGPPREELH